MDTGATSLAWIDRKSVRDPVGDIGKSLDGTSSVAPPSRPGAPCTTHIPGISAWRDFSCSCCARPEAPGPSRRWPREHPQQCTAASGGNRSHDPNEHIFAPGRYTYVSTRLFLAHTVNRRRCVKVNGTNAIKYAVEAVSFGVLPVFVFAQSGWSQVTRGRIRAELMRVQQS
jgi:hypothetical protein